MNIPYIDYATLQADIDWILPFIEPFATKIPGPYGTAVYGFLRTLGSPAILMPVVTLINQLTGSKPAGV